MGISSTTTTRASASRFAAPGKECKNSSSTSAPNSKDYLFQNCLLTMPLDVKSMKISSSAVDSPSEVS
ncbi:hypothetical protein TNCV_590221 [Trichonephila clavipes]|nr:hypothetical protein TNCV_590221 [Trichonephila clavipes]